MKFDALTNTCIALNYNLQRFGVRISRSVNHRADAQHARAAPPPPRRPACAPFPCIQDFMPFLHRDDCASLYISGLEAESLIMSSELLRSHTPL